MARELEQFFRTDATDDAVRAVVVTGAGRAFCAGMDLSAEGNVFGLDEDADPTPEDLRDHLTEEPYQSGVRDTGGKVTLAIHELPKPVIAAINGPAVGIGATMTLAMDIRMASTKARIGFVFGRLGIVPEAASTWFLPRIVGIQQALEWVYSAEILTAEQALQGRLVRSVHEPDDLLPAALELARSFVVRRSPVALGLAKQLLYRNSSVDHPIEAHRADSLAMWHASIGDGREGVAAFLEKRDPEFTGEGERDPAHLLTLGSAAGTQGLALQDVLRAGCIRRCGAASWGGVQTMSELPTETPSVWEVSARLFERWRAGESEALDDLVRLLSPMLWQVVRASGLDHTAAEDVVQTTWLTLVRSGESITEPRAVAGWLTTSARREAWRVSKQSGRQQPVEDEAIARRLPDEPAPEGQVVLDDDNSRLWACLGTLQRALPATAAHRGGRGPARLLRHRHRARHAGGQHRPHPGTVPRQAAARARNGRGVLMVDEQHRRAQRAAGRRHPADRDRAGVAAGRPATGRPGRRRARRDRRRGPRVRPADPRLDRRRPGRRTPCRSGGERRPAPGCSSTKGPTSAIYVRLTRIEDRTRLDGWVVPVRTLTVQLQRRRPGRAARRAEIDEFGRFEFASARRPGSPA